jgi:protein-arginine kinase activator protein McsA
MQKSALHEGKTPRAADKRQKRLMQLRLRRDHRLEMLQRRLNESLEKEDYAEAAKLRDKIKIVSATIVEE